MRKFGFLLLASASVIGSSAAFAQPAPADASTAPANNSAGLQDIVVTAQRHAQNLLSVPLAIQASTGAQLNNQGIRQISSLQFTTPGLEVQNGTGYTQVYIRGVGNNIFVGADPSVATFIDDVPRIYGSSVNNFFNVDRVEVLKGAQGGLYGRNATGGVINIITKQPSTTKASAEARVSYGEMDTFKAAAYVNVPLSDHIAWNLSAERDSHAGYVKNLARPNPLTAANFPGGGGNFFSSSQAAADAINGAINPQKSYGNENFWAIDSKLLLRASDNFKITLDGDYSKKHDSEGNQWYSSDQPGAQVGAEALYDTFLYGFEPSPPASAPNTVLNCPPGSGCSVNFNGLFPKTKKFTTYSSTPSFANLVDYGGSAKAEWTLPGWTITDIFAYRAQHSLYDQNYSDPVTLDIPIVQNHKWYWYEELRAQSTGSGPFHFLGGATYLRDHFQGNTQNFLLPPIGQLADLNTVTVSTDDVRNWSVYGQVGYDFTHALGLTVSGRYIHESNNAVFMPPTTGLSEDSLASTTVHKFLPAATLSYKLEGGGNIYARYAKGFKSGGINPVVPPTSFPAGSTLGEVFGPEQVDTYEIGYKNSFFDHKVQLTADVFYNNYKGLQTTTVGNSDNPGLIEAIINAGTARTYGAEGSVNWRVARPVTVGVNVGYLNAKYKTFANSDGSVLSTFDFSHSTMLFSPKWQLGVTADLDTPINDHYRLVGNILTSYQSNVRAALSTTPGLPDAIIKAYMLTNLRLGVKTTDDHVGVFVTVTNLFNKGYATFGASDNFGNQLVWGDPRIISGEVQFKF